MKTEFFWCEFDILLMFKFDANQCSENVSKKSKSKNNTTNNRREKLGRWGRSVGTTLIDQVERKQKVHNHYKIFLTGYWLKSAHGAWKPMIYSIEQK